MAEPIKRPPKGHRQRGAGTITVGKPAIVTQDGVTLKAHERLPSTLLQQLCQKDGRPKPVYLLCKKDSHSQHQYTALLNDKKNVKANLYFTPVQNEFESEKVGKDYAALLALFHFQKALPLERTLPSPYRESWTSMVTASKADAKLAGKGSSSSSKKETVASTMKATSKTTSSSGSISISSTSVSVTSTVAVSESAPPAPTSVSSNTPAVITDLRNKSKTESKVQLEQMRNEQKKRSNYFQGKLAGLQQENAPPSLHLTPALIQRIQYVLKASQTSGSNGQWDTEQFSAATVDPFMAVQSDPSSDTKANRRVVQILQPFAALLPIWSNSHLENELKRVVENGRDDSVEYCGLLSVNRPSSSSHFRYLESSDERIYSDFVKLCIALINYANRVFMSVPDVLTLKNVNGQASNNSQNIVDEVDALESVLLFNPEEETGEVFQHRRIASVGASDYSIVASDGYPCGEGVHYFIPLDMGDYTPWKELFSGKEKSYSHMLFCWSVDIVILPDVNYLAGAEVVASNSSSSDCSAKLLAMLHVSPIQDSLLSNKTAFPYSGMRLKLLYLQYLLNRFVSSHMMSLLEEDGGGCAFRIKSYLENELYYECLDILSQPNSLCDIVEKRMNELCAVSSSIGAVKVAAPSQNECLQVGRKRERKGYTGASFWDRSPKEGDAKESAFQFCEHHRQLPAWNARESFMSHLNSSDLTQHSFVVTGQTGSGKTTQIPQYIHHQNSNAKILICQPRRLAAVSVANRIAEEIDMAFGQSDTHRKGSKKETVMGDRVGYVIRGDAKMSNVNTRIMLCTYGVLLRRLQQQTADENNGTETDSIEGIDYIVLDELHERSAEGDVVLTLIRQVQTRRFERFTKKLALYKSCVSGGATSKPVYFPLKVIIMSATISTDKFVNYLASPSFSTSADNGAKASVVPIISIPGRTFPVQVHYKNEFESLLRSFDDYCIGGPRNKGAKVADKGASAKNYSIPRVELVDYDLLIKLMFRLLLLTTMNNGVEECSLWPSGDSTGHSDNDGTKSGNTSVFRPSNGLNPYHGGILVFLPGVPEINKCIRLLQQEIALVISYLSDCFRISPNARSTGYDQELMSRMLASPGSVLFIVQKYVASECISPSNVQSVLNMFSGLMVLPLHGNLSPADQKKVTSSAQKEKANPSMRKIIISTNVAEASVTIPDITIVIDSCRVKVVEYDADRNISCLLTKIAAKDSMTQRTGRAGRIQPGLCFRLVTTTTYEKQPATSVPEILRMPLEGIILNLKFITQTSGNSKVVDCDDTAVVLSSCLDPPATSSITSAMNNLLSMGAVSRDSDSDVTTNITALGKQLAQLPCDPRIGKLLVFGVLFQCITPLVYLAAALTCNNPYMGYLPTTTTAATVTPPPPPAPKNVLTGSTGSTDISAGSLTSRSAGSIKDLANYPAPPANYHSDHLRLVGFIQQFHRLKSQSYSNQNQRNFCYDNKLSFETMSSIVDAAKELFQSLVDIGMLNRKACTDLCSGSTASDSDVLNVNMHKDKIVISSISSCLYPNVVKILRPQKKFAETVGGAVEKDSIVGDYKFYIPSGAESSVEEDEISTPRPGHLGDYLKAYITGLQRVLLRSSSCGNAGAASAVLKLSSSTSYLLFTEKKFLDGYNSMVTNRKPVTSDDSLHRASLYITDVTEIPIWSLLLFGGQVTWPDCSGGAGMLSSAESQVIKIDGWISIVVRDVSIVPLLAQFRSLVDRSLMSVLLGDSDYTSSQTAETEKSVGTLLLRTITELLESDI